MDFVSIHSMSVQHRHWFQFEVFTESKHASFGTGQADLLNCALTLILLVAREDSGDGFADPLAIFHEVHAESQSCRHRFAD